MKVDLIDTPTLKGSSFRIIIFILVVLYLVAVVGFSFEAVRHWFIFLTPCMLLANCALLFLLHEGNRQGKLFISLVFIAVTGFVVEVVGVETKVVFGDYHYGSALGVKIADTPLLIGMNWAMLSYLFAEISSRFYRVGWMRILVATFGMLLYDIIMEQVAPVLDYWHWNTIVIPIQNYIAWGLLALLFQCFIVLFHRPFRNSLSSYLVCFQMAMFFILNFTLS